MAKVIAYTQDNRKYSLEGSWDEMTKLYDSLCKETVQNIKVYHQIELYNDSEIGMGVYVHPTKELAKRFYDDIRGTLMELKMPLYGVDDNEIARLMSFTDEAFQNLGNAFRAFHITEKQGGCWVFE